MSIIKTDDIWETPPDIYHTFCNKVGIYPEIDVCASRLTSKCPHYFGPDQFNPMYRDGLANIWNRPFFMNPPYSEKEDWFEYALKQSKMNNVPGIILVFAKTDTRWWNKLVNQNDSVTVYFHMGRIRFWKEGKPGPNPAPYGSAWIVVQ